MKNIVITPKRIKLEALFFLAALIIAEGFNIYGIIKFDTNWSELWTQTGTVIVLGAVFYGLFAAIRIILALLLLPFMRNKRKSTV